MLKTIFSKVSGFSGFDQNHLLNGTFCFIFKFIVLISDFSSTNKKVFLLLPVGFKSISAILIIFPAILKKYFFCFYLRIFDTSNSIVIKTEIQIKKDSITHLIRE